MEIDITDFVVNESAYEFSASRAERGQNAGPETWANSMTQAKRKPLLQSKRTLAALRHYVRDFGAWENSEIKAWSTTECNALFIQLVSGDLREAEALCSTDDGEID